MTRRAIRNQRTIGTNVKDKLIPSHRDSLIICCIGDTHGLYHELMLPQGDLLIHTGDAFHMGGSLKALLDFNSWLGSNRTP
jgi:hypothetical protein